MATFIRRILTRSRSAVYSRQWQKFRYTDSRHSSTFALILGGSACYGSYVVLKKLLSNQPPSLFGYVKAKEEAADDGEAPKETSNYREVRFRQFASVEYDNNIYMTPQDFLESVTEESPRARIGRLKLSPSDVENMLKKTPTLKKGNDHLFRGLHNQGIISYTEYLFLLCVLTKPQSGFLIAFNMFDTDGNQIVDKREFLVLENFFVLPPKERKFVPRDSKKVQKLLDLQNVYGGKEASKNEEKPVSTRGTSSKQALQERATALTSDVPDTTLLVHFFGRSGKNALKYREFHKFMANLQSEVIELEFLEFSKGLNTISEVEFARILLRYTNLDRGDKEECIKRVRERMPNEQGITFTEFKKFCQFLNNLDDFAIAMKMYTYAQQPVSKEEFQRAVMVCTGFTLSAHIVSTVFNMLDTDGDGNLSHKEFISIMKDRLHRGARSHLMHRQNTWESFKTCVKNEMRTY